MSRRVSSLDKTTVGIDRDISSQYDNVKIVADNLVIIEAAAGVASDAAVIVENITDIQNAEENAQAAIDSASAALTSENKAHQWAEEAEDVEVDPGEYSAHHWATKADAAAAPFTNHLSNDGSDHSFIDQDVTTNASPSFQAVQLPTGVSNPPHAEGLTFYDDIKKALSYYNDNADITINLGQELVFPVVNNTGSLLSNGTIVTPYGGGIALADRRYKNKSRLLAVCTSDIANGASGYVTRLGQVGGLDTSSYSVGDILHLGEDGLFQAAPPTDGTYHAVVGVVDVVDVSEGIITVDIATDSLTVEVTDTNGFPPDQRTGTTMSIDNTNRIFTIAPVGDRFHCYVLGDKYEYIGAQTVEFPDIEGNHWFYFDANGLQTKHEPTGPEKSDIVLNSALVAYIHWNATDKAPVIDIFDERHGIGMAPATHAYLHLTRGSQYVSGFAIGDVLTDQDGSLDTHAQFSITSGTFVDEDNTHTSSALAVGDTIPVIYSLGESWIVREGSQTGFAFLNNPGGRVYFNEYTGGAWQLTEATSGYFVLYHIFAINGDNEQIISIMGINQYPNSSAARTAASQEIADVTTNISPEEAVPIATVIVQTKDNYTNSVKARLISTETGEDFVDWRTSERVAGSAPSSHANLTDLNLAVAGVTFGHIDDQAQTIAGEKTFSTVPKTTGTPTDGTHLVTKTYADTHPNITSGNPHNVTKTEVGLSNVDNTSDANKPISTATQTALDTLSLENLLVVEADFNANAAANRDKFAGSGFVEGLGVEEA